MQLKQLPAKKKDHINLIYFINVTHKNISPNNNIIINRYSSISNHCSSNATYKSYNYVLDMINNHIYAFRNIKKQSTDIIYNSIVTVIKCCIYVTAVCDKYVYRLLCVYESNVYHGYRRSEKQCKRKFNSCIACRKLVFTWVGNCLI